MSETNAIAFENWGLIDYREALFRQNDHVEKVRTNQSYDLVIFCCHPPLLTLGRKSDPTEYAGWNGDKLEVNRGGRVTYHGPNQLVIYPVIDLRQERRELRARDVHQYLRALETVTARVLVSCGCKNVQTGFEMSQKLRADENSHIDELSWTGVWINDHKVASIGVAVRSWVTSHGIALNLHPPKEGYVGFRPCGFEPSVMTSLEELGYKISREELISHFQNKFQTIFSCQS